MTFKDFKDLQYPDDLPLEFVLADVLYKRLLNINQVLSAYSAAVEKDRDENRMRFEEACTCLIQHLSGNWNGEEDRDKLNKRMISISNKSSSLPHHLYDKVYGFTEEDKNEWEDFYKTIYGRDLKL